MSAVADRPFDLISARLNRGLSRAQAATSIGIARGTLRKAELGVCPHPEKARAIADFYGVRVTDIWPVDEPSAA